MTKRAALSTKSVSRIRIVAIVGVVIGLIAVVLAAGLDWHGFGGGLVTGGGIGVMLISVYVWGHVDGLRRTLPSGGWRPSVDSAP